MKRCVTIFFTLLAYLFLPQLEALNRDYRSDCDEDETYQNYYKPYCLYHAPGNYPDGISHELFYLIPQTGPAECCQCYDLSCYLGYIDYDFKKYLPHLKRHLEYCSQHNDCVCYWPEYSQEAALISDTAYILFRDLISTTALSNLIEDENQQKELVENPCWFLNKHGLTILFIAQQFRFSDYYHVCGDIENFAVSKYEEREAAKIKDRLQDILEALYPKFFALYISCYKKHPNSEIDQEIRFMKLLVNDISGLDKTVVSSKSISCLPIVQNSYDVSEFIVANLQTANIPVELESKGMISKKNQTLKKNYSKALSLNISASSTVHSSKAAAVVFSPQSDIFLEQGTLLNDLLLYKEAIQVLTQAIQLNPSNRNAYIERAMAYFETNQLSLALKDYESAKKLTITPPFKPGSHKAMMMMAAVYIPENKTEFSKGLVSGTVDGAKVSAVEFIPSIFSCCRGILNGLWAFVCSPIEVSQEMVNTAYAIGEFISNHSTEECFQCVVPELKELSLSWDKLNDHSRGQKIGFIIGKYGVDIFAPAGALKGMNKVRALKRANTMCTLESCAASQAKQAKILEESAKRASIREKIVSDSIKNGKILVRNSNTQIHIMQPKHAWDKLVKMSGNVEEDCKKVIKLLEDNQIVLEKYRVKPTETFEKFVRYNHQMEINGHEVKAIFNKNIETGEMFLNDTWVITK
jgi:tetratricopeptide (TPR) repeat protein